MANLRDLGGTAIAGGIIRPGLLLRSAAPARFGPEARRLVQAMGPVAIADLRSAAEQAASPTDFLAGARQVVENGDDGSDVGDPAGFAAACTVSERETRAAIHRIYAAIPAAHEAAFGDVFRALAGGDVPLLVHCAVGKDRTGAAVAILLAALGAAPSVIEADYLSSNDSFEAIAAAVDDDPRMAGIRAAPRHVWAPMLRADAAYLESLFAALALHGGAAAYVTRAVGAGGLDRIAARLLHG